MDNQERGKGKGVTDKNISIRLHCGRKVGIHVETHDFLCFHRRDFAFLKFQIRITGRFKLSIQKSHEQKLKIRAESTDQRIKQASSLILIGIENSPTLLFNKINRLLFSSIVQTLSPFFCSLANSFLFSKDSSI